MSNALRFLNYSVPRQDGELARLKVVKGPDQGSVFVVTGNRVSVGRGEECDIVLSDLKASRFHAEVQLTATGWALMDGQSANGLLHNGKTTRQAFLKTGDTFSMGDTTLEWFASEAATTLLQSPPRSIGEVKSHQQKIHARGGHQSQGGFGKFIVILGAGIGFYFFLDSDSQKKPSLQSSSSEQTSSPEVSGSRELAAFLPQNQDKNGEDLSYKKSAEIFFKEGFREFVAGNYLRARPKFETALQIDPGHRLARLYIENAEVAMREQVNFHLIQGKKAFDSGKLKEARGHYETVIRLLFKDRSNPSFQEAQDLLSQVKKEMKGEG